MRTVLSRWGFDRIPGTARYERTVLYGKHAGLGDFMVARWVARPDEPKGHQEHHGNMLRFTVDLTDFWAVLCGLVWLRARLLQTALSPQRRACKSSVVMHSTPSRVDGSRDD